MDDSLKEALKAEEKVLWQGSPEPFVTLDKTNKMPFIVKAVITVAVCLGMIIPYCVYGAEAGNMKIGLPLVIAGIGILVIISNFLDARKLRKEQILLTDSRILWKSDSVREVPYSSIKEYLFSMDEDGHTTLLIGVDAVKKKSRKWRTMASSTVFMNTDTGVCEQAVIYAIPQPDEFKKIFEAQLR